MIAYGYKHSCLVLLLSVLLFACSEPLPDEKQLRLAIQKMQQASDEKQLSPLMAHFADSFQGRHGMRKRDLQARIFFHFRINPRVRVFVSNTDIQVNGGQARVSCHLLVTGSQQTVPDRGRFYRVESDWQKQGDTWRVMKADWDEPI